MTKLSNCANPTCGISLAGRKGARSYCSSECAKIHFKSRTYPSAIRSCVSPFCNNTWVGKRVGGKKYCSERCRESTYWRLGRHPQRPEYGRLQYAKKTEENQRTAPLCTICGKSTARGGYNNATIRITPLVPDHVHLCCNHTKAYAQFVRHNDYWSFDPDEVFAIFLVRLTFTNTAPGIGKAPMAMIKAVFHSSKT